MISRGNKVTGLRIKYSWPPGEHETAFNAEKYTIE